MEILIVVPVQVMTQESGKPENKLNASPATQSPRSVAAGAQTCGCCATLTLDSAFNGESSHRQAVFTSRKSVPSSRVVGIETKVRAFRIQSYFRKSPLVPSPVGPRARGGVDHKPLGKHVSSMACGFIYLSPEITLTLHGWNTFFRFFQVR